MKKTKPSKKAAGKKKPVKKPSKKIQINKKPTKKTSKKSQKKPLTQKPKQKTKKSRNKKALAKNKTLTQKKIVGKRVPAQSFQAPEKLAQIKKMKSLKALLSHREKELEKILAKEKEEKLILKDMEGRKYCIVENCDYPAIVDDHCRLHFFALFKKIKKKKVILERDLITKSLKELLTAHSESVFEHLFKDLSSDKHFKLAIKKISDEETQDLNAEKNFID